ncbi:MAG: M15 family metallopeptidase [Nocardioides sp.]
MDDVVLMSDPRVTGIPVAGDAAGMVDVTGSLPVDQRKADATGAWRLLRAPVLDRLVDAAERLPRDLRLVLVEGYRPTALQTTYFEGYREWLRVEDPTLSDAELHRLASRYVSPPEVAPHTAGAAVDVTLRGVDDVELDVGCPVNASPEQSGGRCYTAHPDVVGEALLLRRTLAAALERAGLVNYPTEWWHWSYGDRYWAYATGADRALYGPLAAG